MKKVLIIVVLLFVGAQAYSQEITANGNIRLSDGRSTVQISVGNQSSSNAQLAARVILLERAVRDLQDMVYDLRLNDVPAITEIEYTCRIETSFNRTYTATGLGANEQIAENNAREAVMSKCRSNESFSSNCTERHIKRCYQSR